MGTVAHRGGKLTNADAVLLGVLAALGVGTFAVLAFFAQKETQKTVTEGP